MQRPITALGQQSTSPVLAYPLTTSLLAAVVITQDTVLVVDTLIMLRAIDNPLSICDTLLVSAGIGVISTMALRQDTLHVWQTIIYSATCSTMLFGILRTGLQPQASD